MNDKINPQGYNIKADPTNRNPFWGDDPMPGEKETLTVKTGTTSATPLPAGSTPTASVTNSGSDYHAILDFEFGIPAGEQGPQGEQGTPGKQGDPGPEGPRGPEGPQGLQGEKGDPGPKGEQGSQGPAGTVSIGAVTATAGETASAAVTNSGTDTNAELSFSFTLPRGEKGEAGPQGPEGPQGLRGPEGPRGPQGEKGDPGPQGKPGQVPSKTDDANDFFYAYIWHFNGKFTADITVAEITGSSILATKAQNIDVQIDHDPLPSFIIPGTDEKGASDYLYQTVLVPFNNDGTHYCLQAIAGYSSYHKKFRIQLPNPDVRIRELNNGEIRVCIAQITKLTYKGSDGSEESITDIDPFLSIPESEFRIEKYFLKHSHTISK